MAEFVYALCTFMSLACTFLLFRSHQQNRGSLLLWSSLCFGLLALNNTFLFFDLVIFPELDIGGPLWRGLSGALAGSVLLFGLIWEVT
ncbi:MAG: DUF5985 family protein [Bdellovibrionales bacterium]